MSKMISIYGTKTITKQHTYKQRYWKTRKDGVKQRYWKKVTRKQRYHASTRFDISGTGKDIKKAITQVLKRPLVPKERFVEVEAKDLARDYSKFAEEGEWTRRPSIKSP